MSWVVSTGLGIAGRKRERNEKVSSKVTLKWYTLAKNGAA